MILDQRTRYFDWTRSTLSFINTPFNTVLTVPVRMRSFYEDYWPNKQLRDRIGMLQNENQRLAAKVQKYDAIEIEKNRLLVLLAASQAKGEAEVKIGRIIRTNIEGPYDQRIMIDRGERDGVTRTQAVIDANGVIGQVSGVARDHSVVTVITDAVHAVPVEVLRNGLNAVARGTGDAQALIIPFMSFQADIEVGDVLVTSGLGGVFPSGHPVAEVYDIEGVSGEPFLSIKARPFAELNKVKNILLLQQTAATDLPLRRAANENATVSGQTNTQINSAASSEVLKQKKAQHDTALTSDSIMNRQKQGSVE
jgi:rod shape-determining protein MreC